MDWQAKALREWIASQWKQAGYEIERQREREPLYERTFAFDPWNEPPSFEEMLARGWIRKIETPHADALLDSMGVKHRCR